jgi:hypothetical protein
MTLWYLMKNKILLSLLAIMCAGLVLLLLSFPASATPNPQVVYQTPTASANGRIIYVVSAGESCLSISLKTGTSIDQLRALNNLDADCTLMEGQELLLGVVQEAPAAPAETPTPSGPTPTPFNGNGSICVFLYNDVNGNALAEENEAAIPGGEVSVTDREGDISLVDTTIFGLEPLCFQDIPEGDYNISVAAPEGYNSTTLMNYSLALRAGESSTLDFGAQISSMAVPVPVSEGGRSPLLGILGGILVLVGAGLGIYVWRSKS